MSDFYSQNDYRNYLQHHGIKGMRWGEQNGPPYPLSTKVHNMVVRNRARRAEKRREKILHDPRKLVKHAPEFTKEEIDNAVAKLDSIEQARRRIKPTAKEVAAAKKAEAAQKNAADTQLAKKIDKYGPNAAVLEKNTGKFTNDELREAVTRVGLKHDVYNKKMSELDRPRKFLQLGSDLLATIGNTISNAKRIGDLFEPKYDPQTGLTKEEARLMNIYEKNKNNPEKLKALGVGINQFADRVNKINGRDVSRYEDLLKDQLDVGNINWDDIPDDLQDILRNKKGFKQYAN